MPRVIYRDDIIALSEGILERKILSQLEAAKGGYLLCLLRNCHH